MADQLAAGKPDVIFAEPVGSCIDLNATVIRPIQTLYSDRLRLGPLSVLLDPATSSRLRSQALDDDVRYLVSHQLAEADLVCTTKEDLDPGRVELPFPNRLSTERQNGPGRRGLVERSHHPFEDHRSAAAGCRLLPIRRSRGGTGLVESARAYRFGIAAAPRFGVWPVARSLESALTRAGIFIAHLRSSIGPAEHG